MNAPADTLLGVFEGMSQERYRANGAMSNGKLSALAQCPAIYHALHEVSDRPPEETTEALIVGALAHCVVLEPNEFDCRYVVKPAGHDGRTREGKAWLASIAGSGRLEIITQEQRATALAQRQAVLAVPELAHLLSNGRSEVSAFWIDEATGLHCRCRPDHVHPLADGRDILFDLKTTPDSSPAAFQRTVWEHGYHRQNAFYRRGWQKATGREVAAFIFGAVSKKYPFIAVPYLLDDAAVQRGDDECTSLLQTYVECRRNGVWPAYGDGVQVISLPAWAKRTLPQPETA